VRCEENALIVPETGVWSVLKLSDVDIERNTAKLVRCERFNECFFVDDLSTGNVDQYGPRLHGCEGFSANQFCGLWCPLTANGYEVTLAKKFMKMVRTPEMAKLG
jgi:hypothetical protein